MMEMSKGTAPGWLGLLCALGVALPAAAETGKIEGPPALLAEAERPRQVLLPMKRALAAALEAAMAESPSAAIDACRLSAPGITEGAAVTGIRVGRTSHRLRNPSNAPEGWMRPLLAEYLRRSPVPGTGRVVDLGAGRVGYVEPIYIKQVCVTCHGKNIDPDLLAHIRERYPDDRAVDFEPGEFRGLLWVVSEVRSE